MLAKTRDDNFISDKFADTVEALRTLDDVKEVRCACV